MQRPLRSAFLADGAAFCFSGLDPHRADDVKTRKQYKTVEIIVREKDWTPPPARFRESAIISLKIGATEKKLQAEVKALGGRWNPERKV